MRPALAAPLLLAALAACSTTPVSSALPECYSAEDASRYNHLYLQLGVDGAYAADVAGDISMRGSASGRWFASGMIITLRPDHASGLLAGFAPDLRRNNDGTLSLPGGLLPFPGWSPLRPSRHCSRQPVRVTHAPHTTQVRR
jgi:hypothetical protein